jgi:hypothetical protein
MGDDKSQFMPFKVEEKLDINPYDGIVDAVKPNHWLRWLEVYFGCHGLNDEQNICLAQEDKTCPMLVGGLLLEIL